MSERIIKFIRQKDFVFKGELARGACGETVILYDPIIDQDFVCKKYSPIDEPLKEKLYGNFVREIKLLHLLNHPNLVRVFNYYLYPEQVSGYILMELVDGLDIEEYVKDHPDGAGEVFVQAIEGFSHLEKHEILHRDIRPTNVLVTRTGAVKIIDFGFGKQIASQRDFGKSISLNWWCEPPLEFADLTYDYRTEVYFVGKLFEKLIHEASIDQFPYMALLAKMCVRNPAERIESFGKVKREILSGQFADSSFSQDEVAAYRGFADDLTAVISNIESGTKYFDDVDETPRKLEDVYRSVMLEEFLPSSSVIIGCFVNGSYYFNQRGHFRVATLRDFIKFLRACSREKKEIVMSNLHARLDSVSRYQNPAEFDDDIPF